MGSTQAIVISSHLSITSHPSLGCELFEPDWQTQTFTPLGINVNEAQTQKDHNFSKL